MTSFNLNSYSTQKVLCEEASSLDDAMFDAYFPRIKLSELLSEVESMDCDNLENIIKKDFMI
tara:strand:+ start:5 stop:190 length:186 start_codon:yes stop_codon:yes gene_type:complete